MRCIPSLLAVFTAIFAATPTNLQRDLAAGNQAWVDALKIGDAESIGAIYSADSVHCDASGACVRGQAATAAQYGQVIAKFGRATDAFVRSEALRVDGDLAYETGYSEAHFANGVVRRGRFSTVWKLQPNGEWRIFRNVSLPPAP